MKSRSIFFVMLILMLAPFLCGFKSKKPTEEELSVAQKQLDELYAEDCMGYDLAFQQKAKHMKHVVYFYFVDFDKGIETCVQDSRKGNVGNFEHAYSVHTKRIYGDLENGWTHVSNPDAKKRDEYNVYEDHVGMHYTDHSRSEKYYLSDLESNVDGLLKEALSRMNPVDAIIALSPPSE